MGGSLWMIIAASTRILTTCGFAVGGGYGLDADPQYLWGFARRCESSIPMRIRSRRWRRSRRRSPVPMGFRSRRSFHCHLPRSPLSTRRSARHLSVTCRVAPPRRPSIRSVGVALVMLRVPSACGARESAIDLSVISLWHHYPIGTSPPTAASTLSAGIPRRGSPPPGEGVGSGGARRWGAVSW